MGVGRCTPPTRAIAVERSPAEIPAAVSAVDRNVAAVVFPSVPVTPMTISSSDGSPSHQAAASASARRACVTVMTSGARSPGAFSINSASAGSASVAIAPRAIASAENSAPLARAPRIATNIPPGRMRRESLCTPEVISCVVSARTSAASAWRSPRSRSRATSARIVLSGRTCALIGHHPPRDEAPLGAERRGG